MSKDKARKKVAAGASGALCPWCGRGLLPKRCEFCKQRKCFACQCACSGAEQLRQMKRRGGCRK